LYYPNATVTFRRIRSVTAVCLSNVTLVLLISWHAHLLCKGFPYSIPSVGPGADPGVQAFSLQVTVSHPRGGRLSLLSARPAVTSPAAEHHCPLAGTKLYCLVTEAHRCEQLAQGCYVASPRVGFEPVNYRSQVQRSTLALPRHILLCAFNKLIRR